MLDVVDFDHHEAAIAQAAEALQAFDIVLIAHGSLPDQRACETSVAATREALDVNAFSVISLATLPRPGRTGSRPTEGKAAQE